MYIYIFEDNTVQKHKDGPTKIDLDCVDQGTLIVLKVGKNVSYVDYDGDLMELSDCVVMEEENGDRFHSPG